MHPALEGALGELLKVVRSPRLRKSEADPASDAIVGISVLEYPPVRGFVGTAWTATARSVRGSAWILSGAIRLQLGLHRFGHTRAPDATAAHWDADEVG